MVIKYMYVVLFKNWSSFKILVYIGFILQCFAIVDTLYLVISPYSFSTMSVALSDMLSSLRQVKTCLADLQSIDLDHDSGTCANIFTTCGLITAIIEDLLGVGNSESEPESETVSGEFFRS